jgi:dihydroorotate dehydrogenase (NAD+) catalytic subunit
VKSGCIVGSEAGEMGALMRRVRPLTAKPLIVKLTPNVSEIQPVARAAQDGGADALSLINTLRAAAVDPVSGAPWLGAGSGGLSGPAVRPVALALIAEVAAATELPLVGMGGIQEGRHALDFIAQGAACVAVGTESFRDPMAGERVRDELARELQQRSRRGVHDARPAPRGARSAS